MLTMVTQNPHLHSWHWRCCPGSGSSAHTEGGNWHVGFLWHREGFSLLGSPWDCSCSGPETVQALPMFHALMGYDMVSCLARHGKRTVLALGSVDSALSELTRVFSPLHQLILMKMPWTPLTGSSYCFTTEQAPQPIWWSGPGSCNNIAITDWLGLDQDQRRVWTSLDNATRSIQDLPWACLLQMQEGCMKKCKCKKATRHTTVCLRRGVLSELNLHTKTKILNSSRQYTVSAKQ